jgi:hypothetical protein
LGLFKHIIGNKGITQKELDNMKYVEELFDSAAGVKYNGDDRELIEYGMSFEYSRLRYKAFAQFTRIYKKHCY